MTNLLNVTGAADKAAVCQTNFETLDASSAFKPAVPIGGIIPWAKSLTGVPALPIGWVQCDGQTLSDAASPLNGQVIPNLNGQNRFLRGNATSGGTGGADSHNHGLAPLSSISADTNGDGTTANAITNENSATEMTSTLPPYYNVVWIIRVK
jgi:hypothetical protein